MFILSTVYYYMKQIMEEIIEWGRVNTLTDLVTVLVSRVVLLCTLKSSSSPT